MDCVEKKIRSIAFLLSLLAASGFISTIGYADQFGDFTYTEHADHIEITDFPTSFFGAVIIPESIVGKPVTIIGDSAFSGCSFVSSISIPKSVVSVGSSAFSNCVNLLSITLPDGITSISNGTFNSCERLSSFNIPESVTSIGDHAFSSCVRLNSLTIPSSVVSIGKSAFIYCSSLTSIVLPDGITSIQDFTFFNCSGLSSISLPNSITSIGILALAGCSSLSSIEIPSDVVSIGSSVFDSCFGLTSIVIPNKVSTIGSFAFVNCINLSSIEIPDSVVSLGVGAFKNCFSISSIDLPNSISTIEHALFEKCTNLTTIHIPEGVQSIGSEAFKECSKLSSINIPDNVTSIGLEAFFNCSELASLSLPENVGSIGRRAFENCAKLKEINIPSGIASIDFSTFRGCSSLSELVIPSSVSSTGLNAFSQCSSLSKITFLGDAPTVSGPEVLFADTPATVYYLTTKDGFTSPTWQGRPVSGIDPLPFFTEQPSSTSVEDGMPASFMSNADGFFTPSLQWQRKTLGSESWINIVDDAIFSGSETIELTLSSALLAMSGDQFRCKAENSEGSTISNIATLTVTIPLTPPSFQSHPLPFEANEGLPSSFAVEVSGNPNPNLNWQRKAAGGEEWETIFDNGLYSHTKFAQLVITTSTLEMSGDQFRCKAENSEGISTSEPAILIVIAESESPVFKEHPSSSLVKHGESVMMRASAEGEPPLSYKWQLQMPGSYNWIDLSNDEIYKNVDTNEMEIANVTFDMSGRNFRCVAIDSIGTSFSNTALLSVTPLFPITNLEIDLNDHIISTPSLPGWSFQLQYKVDLRNDTWSDVGEPIIGDGNYLQITHYDCVKLGTLFYRIIAINAGNNQSGL